MIKVLLVDDQKLVRIAVASLLSGDNGINVVSEADNGADAIAKAKTQQPDMVIVDVEMPGMSGVEVTAQITVLPHQPKVIALSVHTQPPWPQRLLAAGALGYIAKERSVAELIEAVHTVYRGDYYFSPTLVGSLGLGKKGHGFGDPFAGLSNRQLEVMTMLVKGQSPESIAELLHVSAKTVYTHRDRIRMKLGVSNDVQMTHMAIRYGIVKVS